MVVTMDINYYLNNLGFTQKEQEIYKVLLDNGAQTIAGLTRITGIPRTTVNRNCLQLTKKHYIENVIDEFGNTRYKVVSPDKLFSLIDIKKEELNKTEDAIKSLQKIVQNGVRKTPKTEVKYYYGVEGMKQLIWNSLDADKCILGYSTWGREQIVGQKFEDKLVQEMKLRKKFDKVIIDMKGVKYLQSIAPKGYHAFQNVKVLEDLDIVGDIYIYNDIFAINNWSMDYKEVVSVEIRNSTIADVQKSIFNELWKDAKDIRRYFI